MDFAAFSHGQIHSKLWLCEQLEPKIKTQSNVVIIGSWYNVLGMMMLIRKSELYSSIVGVEVDQNTTSIANKICDAWMINNDQKIINKCISADSYNYEDCDIVICTSVEDIQSSIWFDKIPKNKLIALQTINLTADQVKKYQGWNILNPNPTLQIFKSKFPMSEILFEGQKEFDYGELKYNRFMIIGKK